MSGEADPSSISELVRRAAGAKPDGIALIDGDKQLRWAELDQQATAAALALGAAGLGDGDRVALQLGTSIDFVLLYVGANRAGLISVPVNPAYTLPELSHVLVDCGAELLVTSSPAGLEASAREVVVAGEQAPDGRRTVRDLLASAPAGDDPRRDRSGEDTAVLLYTSGTSGQPRGAMLSARALIANLTQVTARGGSRCTRATG